MNSTTPHVCTTVESPLGPLLLAANPAGLCGVWFTGQRHFPPTTIQDHWNEVSSHPVLQKAAHQLADYFQGQPVHFDVPLDLSTGTPFQQSVWRALLQIPCATTHTYSAVAQRIGQTKAVRAVGSAIGRNPLSIVVPCHRVLGTGGALTGYAGGLDRKAALLRLERGESLLV